MLFSPVKREKLSPPFTLIWSYTCSVSSHFLKHVSSILSGSNKTAQNILIIDMPLAGYLLYVNTFNLLRGLPSLIFYFIPKTFFFFGASRARIKFQNQEAQHFHLQWNLNYDHLSDFLQSWIQQIPGTIAFSPAYSLFESTVPVRNFNCNENQFWLI